MKAFVAIFVEIGYVLQFVLPVLSILRQFGPNLADFEASQSSFITTTQDLRCIIFWLSSISPICNTAE